MTPTSERLQKTLARLMEKGTVPSAVELCKEAGISRTALYRYHADMVVTLRDLHDRSRNEFQGSKMKVETLLAENKDLKRKVEQLASLVDHYFNAWQESEASRHRQERELARVNKIKVFQASE